MAHHTATKKSILQTETRTERNTARRSRVRTAIKKVVTAIEAGDKDQAKANLITAQSELSRAVTKGVFKKEQASRKISRLNSAVKKLVLAK